jgi:uncharacterized membrane protein YbaN (DUF454 family)
MYQLRRIFIRVVGIGFIILGIITSLLPIIPTGFIFNVLGILILASTSRRLTNYIRRARKRYPSLNEKLIKLEEEFPNIFRKLLKKTKLRG